MSSTLHREEPLFFNVSPTSTKLWVCGSFVVLVQFSHTSNCFDLWLTFFLRSSAFSTLCIFFSYLITGEYRYHIPHTYIHPSVMPSMVFHGIDSNCHSFIQTILISCDETQKEAKTDTNNSVVFKRLWSVYDGCQAGHQPSPSPTKQTNHQVNQLWKPPLSSPGPSFSSHVCTCFPIIMTILVWKQQLLLLEIVTAICYYC